MKNATIGLFETYNKANDAVRDLEDLGYTGAEISVISKSAVMPDQEIQVENDTSEGVMEGAKAGGVIGGILGLLAGIGVVTLPGLGALFVTGPIAAAFGITGIAGATVSGALTGAIAGGLLAGLKELGIDEPKAKMYEEKVQNGYVMVSVFPFEDEEDEVEDTLKGNGAESVDQFNLKID